MNPLIDALAMMPAKARLPVERLLERKLIDEPTVLTSVEAVRLAGKPDRLLPFITAALYLRSQGVPLEDTIRMSKEAGRKISLDWSPKRWLQQHDRLSRLAALRRLSAQRQQYDLRRFEDALPNHFPGYLIRNSRKLAWEALWQRHCAASYHEKILAGACAIAVVWLDGVRHDVELMIAGDGRLRISQVAAHANTRPNEKTLTRIREALAITVTEHRAETQPRSKEHLLTLLQRTLPVLRTHGFTIIEVRFEGSGDSGTIDSAEFHPDGSADPDAIMLSMPCDGLVFRAQQFDLEQRELQVSLRRAVHILVEAWIDVTPSNWWDGDGGYGEVIIDVHDGTIKTEVNVRTIRESTDVWEEIDIETGGYQ